ncbi:MAG: hypothetical protein JRI84_15165 [Deltaproteobacteria bacterium]|nr:hypothetical protein [Deltaproteobacteria bacterium]
MITKINWWAITASLIQIIACIVVIALLRNHKNRKSILYGVLFTIFILTVKDALPYIVICQKVFTYNIRYHHSSCGIIGFILLGIYKISINIFNTRMNKIYHFLEEKEHSLFGIKINILFILIGIGLILILTQLHEIIYFKNLKYPDRGFPYDIRLWELWG